MTQTQPQSQTPPQPAAAPGPNPLVKLAIEFGPLALFFIAYNQKGIFFATGTFMVAILISLLTSLRIERKLPIMPLVTACFVLVFGGLTLILRDQTFMYLKPTIVNLVFAVTLFVGLRAGRPLLKPLLGSAMQLQDEGWTILTRRWAIFFVCLAVANEVVWRNFSEPVWVKFKVFGILPLTILFTFTQLPLINRHLIAPEGGADADPAE